MFEVSRTAQYVRQREELCSGVALLTFPCTACAHCSFDLVVSWGSILLDFSERHVTWKTFRGYTNWRYFLAFNAGMRIRWTGLFLKL